MVASRDADGGRAQKSKREGAYFFLVAFFFVAFFTVFFGAVFTAFFFAAFAAIVTLTSLSPFEMPEAAGLARQGQQNDAKWPLLCDESRNGPNRRWYATNEHGCAAPAQTSARRAQAHTAHCAKTSPAQNSPKQRTQRALRNGRYAAARSGACAPDATQQHAAQRSAARRAAHSAAHSAARRAAHSARYAG